VPEWQHIQGGLLNISSPLFRAKAQEKKIIKITAWGWWTVSGGKNACQA
jgi:hypothetical protein